MLSSFCGCERYENLALVRQYLLQTGNPSVRLQAFGIAYHPSWYSHHCSSIIFVFLLLNLAVTGNISFPFTNEACVLLSFEFFCYGSSFQPRYAFNLCLSVPPCHMRSTSSSPSESTTPSPREPQIYANAFYEQIVLKPPRDKCIYPSRIASVLMSKSLVRPRGNACLLSIFEIMWPELSGSVTNPRILLE